MICRFRQILSILKKPKERYFAAFGLAFIMACILFIPHIIIDKGYFVYYGDFNAQQIPFYKLAHAAVRNLDIGWDFGTDLGANFMSSYSFYLLGSPFFWLTLPFPNSFISYLMGPLLILKFSCASLTAYAFITKFVKNKTYALLGGIMYAFSGFSVYNIFFNHFHEAIRLFPAAAARPRANHGRKPPRTFLPCGGSFVDFKLLFLLRHGHFHGDIFCREMGVGKLEHNLQKGRGRLYLLEIFWGHNRVGARPLRQYVYTAARRSRNYAKQPVSAP